MAEITGEQVAVAFGDLVSAVDVAALTGDFAAYVAASFRQALANGIWGWLDDDLAFTRPWGFDLASINVPVVVWQVAGSDGPVRPWPVAGGPSAECEGNAAPAEGHLSIAVDKFGEIIGELVASAQGRPLKRVGIRRSYGAGRDATGRTPTGPAAILQSITRQTGAVFLLIVGCRFESCRGTKPQVSGLKCWS